MPTPSFIAFLGHLSARFAAVSADAMDAEILGALEGLVNQLGTDRATFYKLDTRTRAGIAQYQWARQGVVLDPSAAVDALPWYGKKVLAGEPVVVSQIGDLPPEAEAELRDIIQEMLSPAILTPVKPDRGFVLLCDSSDFAVGYALGQYDDDKQFKVNYYGGHQIPKSADPSKRNICLCCSDSRASTYVGRTTSDCCN